MAYIGKTPTAAPLTSSDVTDGIITTAKLAADAVTDAKIADDVVGTEHLTAGEVDATAIANDAITLAKMAGGTDGNIISYDASGNPVAIATGSDGQVLTSTGAGSPPAFEAAGSDFVKLATVVGDPASTATIDINGYFSSTYDMYKIYASEVCPGADDKDFCCRVMISDSINTTSIYVHANAASYLDVNGTDNWQTPNASDTNAPSDVWIQNANNQGNDATINSWLEMIIANPLSTSKHKMLGLKRHYRTDGTSGGEMLMFYSSCWVQTTSALTGISFHFDAGNIGGTYKLYGMK